MSGEGSWVEGTALGEVLQRVMNLFALFGFARHLPVSGLDAFLLHSQGSVNLNKDQFFFFFYFFAAFEMVQAFAQWHGTLPPAQARDVFLCWLSHLLLLFFQGPRCYSATVRVFRLSHHSFQRPEVRSIT